MWSNFHTHSSYCDGKGTLGDYVAQASALGLASLGFSSHAPLPFDCRWCMKPDALPAYLRDVTQLGNNTSGPEVYKGLEVDFIPGAVSPHTFQDQLDYTIGSIHFVDAFPDGRRWEIDGPHVSFLEGLTAIFSGDIRAVVSRYFELTRNMVSTACPTIVGHLDKIKIQNADGKFFHESDDWYQTEVIKTVDLIQTAGAIVEVNTRGIYQRKSSTTYPSPWILELLRERNMPITLSSDAHHPADLVNQFSETAGLLRKIGFTKLSVLRQHRWELIDFDENGIDATP